MGLMDFLKKRKNVVYQESEGVNLALRSINEFKDRTFTFRASKKFSAVDGEHLLILLQEEMDNMLLHYRYTTKVKKYTDRRGFSQLRITLIGKASMMSKYNPLDIKMDIATNAALE